MRFWDTSALVPMLVHEPATEAVQKAYVSDPVVLVAWTTEVECASAVARAEREGFLSLRAATAALARLDELSSLWHEVEPTGAVRNVAVRMLRVHPLRAADALQLASALLAAERNAASLPFVTLDERLEAAARKEGFPVLTGRGD